MGLKLVGGAVLFGGLAAVGWLSTGLVIFLVGSVGGLLGLLVVAGSLELRYRREL